MLHSRGLLETTELGEMCDPDDHEEAEDMIVSSAKFCSNNGNVLSRGLGIFYKLVV